MKKVLVSGATTPLGREVVDRLRRTPDVETILAVGFEPANGFSMACGRGCHVRFERADLTKPRRLHDLLYGPAVDLRIDTVIHTAFHRSPFKVGRRAHLLNVDATRELVRLAEAHPTIEQLVFRSWAEVYRVGSGEALVIGEDHPLELSQLAPQWIRDRVEADLAMCARMGMSKLRIMVLRCAECLADGTGSQLYDYLKSWVCLRPVGFDPMINVISLQDLARALVLAARHPAQGIVNIPGKDTMPLSEVIYAAGRREVPMPDQLLERLYALRRRVLGTEFRYDLNRGRFHLGGVLDGARAKTMLGYEPRTAAVQERSEP